jgi:hypothetical protein
LSSRRSKDRIENSDFLHLTGRLDLLTKAIEKVKAQGGTRDFSCNASNSRGHTLASEAGGIGS